jgi:hypothetical protein
MSAPSLGAVLGIEVAVGDGLGVEVVWLMAPPVRTGGEPATTMADALVSESASTSATSRRVPG